MAYTARVEYNEIYWKNIISEVEILISACSDISSGCMLRFIKISINIPDASCCKRLAVSYSLVTALSSSSSMTIHMLVFLPLLRLRLQRGPDNAPEVEHCSTSRA
jgi:hypothetical protein